MEINPYQSPQSESEPRRGKRGRRALFQAPTVDGARLVISSGTVLPPFCVRTGVPVDEKYVAATRLTWCTPLILFIFVLAGPLVGAIGYFLARQVCDVTFGLHPDVRRKYQRRLLIKTAIALALGFGIWPALRLGFELTAVGLLVMLLVALIMLLFGNRPLSVARYNQGRFWIKGVGPDFLARIEQPTAIEVMSDGAAALPENSRPM